jgi:hypothetical protein
VLVFCNYDDDDCDCQHGRKNVPSGPPDSELTICYSLVRDMNYSTINILKCCHITCKFTHTKQILKVLPVWVGRMQDFCLCTCIFIHTYS